MKALLLAASLTLIAPAALAQVVVVGEGAASSCYQSALTGNSGTISAIRTCDRALEEDMISRRDKAATHVNRGVLLMRRGENVRSEADYRAALAINDKLAEAHINLGVTLFQQDRFEDSLAAYDTALTLDTVSEDDRLAAMTLFNRALVHQRMENVSQAYYDFRAASERRPDWELAQEALTRFTVTPRSSS